MAIDAHSTPAPTDHRALLRTYGARCRVLTEAEISPKLGKTPSCRRNPHYRPKTLPRPATCAARWKVPSTTGRRYWPPSGFPGS